MEFWLLTHWYESPSIRAGQVTLHRDGCGQRRLVKLQQHWSGPLTWDQLALLPLESYKPCRACHPGSDSRCEQVYTRYLVPTNAPASISASPKPSGQSLE